MDDLDDVQKRCDEVAQRLIGAKPQEYTKLALRESQNVPPAVRGLFLTILGKMLEEREAALTQREAEIPAAKKRAARRDPISISIRKIGFRVGIAGALVMLLLAVFIPSPTPFQYFVFRVVLALSAAGFAGGLTGFLNLRVKYQAVAIAATGGFAVLYMVYRWNPPALIFSTEPTDVAEAERK